MDSIAIYSTAIVLPLSMPVPVTLFATLSAVNWMESGSCELQI